MAIEADPTMMMPIESSSRLGISTQLSGRTGMGARPAWKACFFPPARLLVAIIFRMTQLT